MFRPSTGLELAEVASLPVLRYSEINIHPPLYSDCTNITGVYQLVQLVCAKG